MKRVLLVAFAILVPGGVAVADNISVYPDTQASICYLNFTGPNLYSTYVVHTTVTGATGSQFKIVNSTGVAFTASVMNGYLAIGDAFTDLALAYGGCISGPGIAVVRLDAAIFAAPVTDCATIKVVAAPDKDGVLAVDCNFAEIPAFSEPFQLGNSPSSQCACLQPAAEQSTWGKLKSLYR